MKLSIDDIREIQRLYLDGTPVRELARCYQVDESTIRYHCNTVSAEPVKRLERAEVLYLIYVKCPTLSEIVIESLYSIATGDRSTFPRLSRMGKHRFTQIVSSCITGIGWIQTKRSGKIHGFVRPDETGPISIEW